MEKLCPVCKKNPLRGKQRICSSACRSATYRKAQKQRIERITSQQPEQQQKPPAKPVHKRVPRPKRREHPRTESQGLQERRPSSEEMLRAAVAELRGLLTRSAAPLRIDMREQVVAQAPEGAVGYRLVLSHRDGILPPVLIPRRSRSCPRAAYSLTPFEYPDDLRLCDGCWYRIVWIDSQGSRIRTEASVPVPGLRYTVGPVDTSQNVTQVRAETDRSAPFVLPSSQGTASQQVVTEHFAPSTSSSVASFSTDTPASHDAPTSPGPQAPVQINALAVMPVGEQLSAGNAQNPVATVSDPTPPADSPDAITPPPPTPKPSLDPFWDGPGKYAKQLESLAQVLYEQRCIAAKEEGRPPPEEPLTQLSRDERKDIRRAASHPFWKALGGYLNQRFARAKRKGIGAFASLPIVPTPLNEKDKRLMDEVLASPDKRVYLDYLYARRDALLVGDTLPKEPACTLPSAQRKRLAKIVADVRPIAELLSNEEES